MVKFFKPEPKLIFACFLILVAILNAGILAAQVADTQSSNTNLYLYKEPAPKSSVGNYFSLIVKTLFISAVFIASVYFLFKFVAKKQGVLTVNQDVVKILSYIPMGPNRYLQIIEIGKQVFLLGNTENSINLLTEIKDKETIDTIKTAASKQGPDMKVPFIEYMIGLVKKNIPGMKVKSSQKTAQFFNLDFLKKQSKRLKDI